MHPVPPPLRQRALPIIAMLLCVAVASLLVAGMSGSISVAPAATDSSISRSLVSMLDRPAGNAVDTAAIGKRPCRTLTAGVIIS